jgi:hypothetical protein
VTDDDAMGQLKNFLGISARNVHGIHFCLTAAHVAYPDFEDKFIAALESAVRYARENVGKKPKGTLKVYGAVGTGLVPAPMADQLGRAYSLSQNTVRLGLWQSPSAVVKVDEEEKSLQTTGLRRRRMSFNLREMDF